MDIDDTQRAIVENIKKEFFANIRRFKVGLDETIVPQSIIMPLYDKESHTKELVKIAIDELIENGFIHEGRITQKALDSL